MRSKPLPSSWLELISAVYVQTGHTACVHSVVVSLSLAWVILKTHSEWRLDFLKELKIKTEQYFLSDLGRKEKKVKDKFLDKKKKERNNLKIDKQGKRSFQQNED